MANDIHATTNISSLKKQGDYLIFAIPIKLDTLDPILSINAHSKFTLPLIFEPLITLNPQQELQPVLAKSWSINSDNKTITVTLNQGHRFSDGTEATSTDVVNSIYRLCGAKSQESDQLSGLVNCHEFAKNNKLTPKVYSDGKYKVKFHINSSPTTFLFQLSSPSSVVIKETSHGLIGSGPYLNHQKKADYLILNKNHFYSGNISVKNNGIILFTVEGRNIFNSVMKNHPDGALMYRWVSLWNFKNPNYTSINTNPNITEILVLNNQKFPFNNKLVRQALSSELYNHFNYSCIPGAHKAYGIIPNGVGGSISNLAPPILPSVEPEKLFTEFPQLKNEKLKVIIHQLLDTKNSCEAEQITKSGKKYNIDIQFKYHKDYSDLLPLYMNHHLDAFIDLYIFKNRESNNIFDFFSLHGENDANINNDYIDQTLKAAMETPSSHARFQLYHKIAKYIQDENIIIPMFYMDHINLMNKCLIGISNNFIFNPFSELPNISKLNNCNQEASHAG